MAVIVLEEIDSTNTYVRDHFGELADGDFVWARHQTAGRGRRGRAWLTPPGTALTGSFALKNLKQPFHGGCLAGLAGLAVIRRYAPQALSFLKWPNDIYIRERKIAGILCEGVLQKGRITGVAAGIGININQTAELLASVGQPATSLLAETKNAFSIEKLAEELAKELNRYYINCNTCSDGLMESWRMENLLLGERLELIAPDGTSRIGVFTALHEDGSMQIRPDEGNEWCFQCGDVKINAAMIDFCKLETKLKVRKEKK